MARPLMSENRIIIAFSLSPPSFLFRYTPTRHTAEEESTCLQLPAAEGSGTFQPLRLIPIESESTTGSQVGSWTAAAVIDRPPLPTYWDFGSATQSFHTWSSIRLAIRQLHAAYNYSTLDSGNEGRDENLLPPAKRDQKTRPTHRVLVPLLLAPEIYLFTLVACYSFSVVSEDVGVLVDVNRVLHGHHILVTKTLSRTRSHWYTLPFLCRSTNQAVLSPTLSRTRSNGPPDNRAHGRLQRAVPCWPQHLHQLHISGWAFPPRNPLGTRPTQEEALATLNACLCTGVHISAPCMPAQSLARGLV